MRTALGRGGLIALNASLVAVLGFVTWAQGQNLGVRARGEYTMVAGRTTGAGPAAVYIVDAANQEMVALRWDQSKQSLIGLGYRNLAGDGRSSPPGR